MSRDYSKTALHIVQRFFPKVTKVEDATEPLDVEVTAKDVKAGERRQHSECAMAVACKRQEHATGVILSRAVAYIVRGETATRYQLPPSVSRELVSFDRSGVFSPGEYSLTPPNPARRLGADRGRTINRITSAKTYKPHHKRRSHLTEGVREKLGARL